MFFYHYRNLSDKVLAFCRPTFDGVVKTVFLVSIRTLLGETFFRAKTMFFSNRLQNVTKNRSFFVKDFPMGLPTLHSKCSKEHLAKTNFSGKMKF